MHGRKCLLTVMTTFEHCGAGQVIYMTGWAPAASQASALRRGSATVKLEDLAEMQRQRNLTAAKAQGDRLDAGE